MSATAAGSLAVVGFESYRSLFDGVPNSAPNFKEYIEAAKLIDDPIYRSASVLFVGEGGGKSADSGVIAHAGLYQYKDELFLLTQKHVIEGVHDFSFQIPSLDMSGTLDMAWNVYPLADSGKPDPNVRYMLGGIDKDKVAAAIDGGLITPLIANSIGIPKKGEKFAFVMPDKGKLAQMKYSTYREKENVLEFNLESGHTCDGYSGLPVLALNPDNTLTNRSVGLLEGAKPDTTVFLKTKDCGNTLVTVHPHWSAS